MNVPRDLDTSSMHKYEASLSGRMEGEQVVSPSVPTLKFLVVLFEFLSCYVVKGFRWSVCLLAKWSRGIRSLCRGIRWKVRCWVGHRGLCTARFHWSRKPVFQQRAEQAREQGA